MQQCERSISMLQRKFSDWYTQFRGPRHKKSCLVWRLYRIIEYTFPNTPNRDTAAKDIPEIWGSTKTISERHIDISIDDSFDVRHSNKDIAVWDANTHKIWCCNHELYIYCNKSLRTLEEYVPEDPICKSHICSQTTICSHTDSSILFRRRYTEH